MFEQRSCKPYVGNAGNYYSWPATTVEGEMVSGDEANSICPKGWKLTVESGASVESWYYLLRTMYNIADNNDSKIILLPLSLIRSGYYSQGLFDSRSNHGYYWSSTAASNKISSSLDFNAYNLRPQLHYNKYYGMQIRCVAR